MTKKILAALLAASVLTMVPVAAGTSTLPGGGNLVSTVSAAETVSDFASLKSALESGETSISVSSAVIIPAGQELTIDGDVEIQMVGAEATLLVEGTLTLSDNAVLRGNDDADRKVSVVIVENGGVFTMKGGTITGNTARYVSLNVDRCGGGVTVRDGEIGGKFIMNGGTITGNTAMYGGGVHIATTREKNSKGVFEFNNGEITANRAVHGGGVYMVEGTFTMNGGEITDNQADYTVGGEVGSSASDGQGGGIAVELDDQCQGTFIIKGGLIAGNSANRAYPTDNSLGGGIYLYKSTFGSLTAEISGGTIENNTVQLSDWPELSYNSGGILIKSGTSVSIPDESTIDIKDPVACADDGLQIGENVTMNHFLQFDKVNSHSEPSLTVEGTFDLSNIRFIGYENKCFIMDSENSKLVLTDSVDYSTIKEILAELEQESLTEEQQAELDEILADIDWNIPADREGGEEEIQAIVDRLQALLDEVMNPDPGEDNDDKPDEEEEETYLPSTPIEDGFHTYSLGTMYYQDGKRVRGWADIGGERYYFDERGIMATGWKEIEPGSGDWYHFGEDGTLDYGWYQEGNVWYYLDLETGRMYNDGLSTIDKSTYYFYDWGGMASDWWYEAEDGWYFFGGSGAMKAAQWLEWKGEWYYLTENGRMATDTDIGGYYVNADGVWVQ